MSDEQAEYKTKKERKPKKVSPLVVGMWNAERTVFTAGANQPKQPPTNIAEMAAWVRDNYKDTAGRYEFVAARPEKLTIATQTVMKAVLS